MTSGNALHCLQEKKTDFVARCQRALCALELTVFSGDGQLERASDLLCDAVLASAQSDTSDGSLGLMTWAEQCLCAQGVSPFDLLQINAAIRNTAQEMVFEICSPNLAVAEWHTMSAALDRVAEVLTALYTETMQEASATRVHESESLSASLLRATAEADKALIQLRSMHDISQALSSSLEDTGTIFEKLAEKLCVVLDAQHCAIWLQDVGPPYAVATCTAESQQEPTLCDNVDDTVFAHVLQLGESETLTRDADDVSTADQALLKGLGAHTLLLAALSVQEIPIGVVTLGRPAEGASFDTSEIALVESVITQAGVAIQNAGLYEEIRHLNRSLEARVASRTQELASEKERIETLYAIGQALGTSLDLDQVLKETLLLITRAVSATRGSVTTLDPQSESLQYVAVVEDQQPVPAPEGLTPLALEAGVTEWVLEHRETALVQDVVEDQRWQSKGQDLAAIRSLIAAPLVVGNDVYGVLQVSDAAPKAFDSDQQRLVTASAHQIAQAMQNAQLYHREQRERTKTQSVLQSIADGVIVNDTQDKVILINAAAQEILDRSEQETLGEDVWRLFDDFEENGRKDALAALEAISASPLDSVGRVIETTLQVQSKVISAHMTPVVTEADEALGVVTALRDITREVEADRAKSEFVSTVSHELRTPLTSIKGYTDLIHAGAVGEINAQQERFLDIIKNNADRLTALINDLLDISRIESGRVQLKMEQLNLLDIVQQVGESLRGQIESKGLRFEIQVPDPIPDIIGDQVRLNQIVTNLISNAYKYTDEGWIHVSLCPLESALRLDVADSGIGISTEDQGNIFERFYRADTPVMEGRGGTGLGLSITKELVEMHGGRMWVESESGIGSTFTVVLPTAAQDLPPQVLADMPAGAKRILVVDDERDILALLRHQLTTHGYQVITAATGNSAVAKAVSEQPDLITLDVLLPDRHGFDVLRELKSRSETAHIPVVVLSVVQDESSGYRLGAVDYIVKPLNEQRLLKSVERILNRKGRILIAEDTEDTAELLVELLSRHGYHTMHARDGYETLAMARREHPELILLDLRMPGMDGYEALTRLKKDLDTRNIPILVMSAHAIDPIQERLHLQDMGAEDFFAKPLSLERMLEVIEQIVFAQLGDAPAASDDDTTDADGGG